MSSFTGVLKQPKAVYLLSFVEMWNRFSHFGMRALLVLFMIHELHFSDAMALGIYATFCSVDKLAALFGTFLAKRFLSLKKCIFLGGWIVALGHLSLSLGYFFLGLSLLVVGSGLFSTNIITFVGYFYKREEGKNGAQEEARRAQGFTLFYMAINIGALLATFVCGWIAKSYGWEYGFAVAALGMLLGNLILWKFQQCLSLQEEVSPTKPLAKISIFPILLGAFCLAYIALLRQSVTLSALPWVGGACLLYIFAILLRKKVAIGKMGCYLLAYTLFIAAESQIGSSLVVFADRAATHTFLGLSMPSSVILLMNPLVIILLGTSASALFSYLKLPSLQILFPFVFAALSFSLIFMGQIFFSPFPLPLLLAIVGMISFAELLVCPIAYSLCSKTAKEVGDPKITGLLSIGHALGAALGGLVSQQVAKEGYAQGFLQLSLYLLIGGLLLCALQAYRLRKKVTF